MNATVIAEGTGGLAVAMCPTLRLPERADTLTLRPKWKVNFRGSHDKETLHCNRASNPREYPGRGATSNRRERTNTDLAGIEPAIQCGQVSRC